MNYDEIAKMDVAGLRKHCRAIRHEYMIATNDQIGPKELAKMPKARLLYIACRLEAEADASHNKQRLAEVEEVQSQTEIRQDRREDELKRREKEVIYQEEAALRLGYGGKPAIPPQSAPSIITPLIAGYAIDTITYKRRT